MRCLGNQAPVHRADFRPCPFPNTPCSVNDPFVMAAWADAHGAEGKVILLADTHVSCPCSTRLWQMRRPTVSGTQAALLMHAHARSVHSLLTWLQAELTKALGIDAEGLGQVLGGTRMRR